MATGVTEELKKYFLPCHDRVTVTGAGSGIGKAIALSLATLGSHVYVVGRTLQKLEQTAKLGEGLPGKLIPVVCDITDEAQVDATFNRIEAEGYAAALVHAAGESTPGFAQDLTSSVFRNEIESGLGGAFNVLHRWATGLMSAESEGVAVAISSANCSREMPGVSGPSAAKAGVETLVRTFASEWGRSGIRINILGPGVFPLVGEEASELATASSEMFGTALKLIKLGRLGERDEIVAPALFLLSKGASYMTGARLTVDGGMRLLPGLLIDAP